VGLVRRCASQEGNALAVCSRLGMAGTRKPTGSRSAREAAGRTAELFLEHHLFRSLRTGEPIRPEWLLPHYPAYWHYDAPRALTILARMGLVRDPRASEALDLLASREQEDGTWTAAGPWWRPPGSSGSNVEVVDWGRKGPNELVTLDALRVLRAAGRL
jgi:hypothetical protein